MTDQSQPKSISDLIDESKKKKKSKEGEPIVEKEELPKVQSAPGTGLDQASRDIEGVSSKAPGDEVGAKDIFSEGKGPKTVERKKLEMDVDEFQKDQEKTVDGKIVEKPVSAIKEKEGIKTLEDELHGSPKEKQTGPAKAPADAAQTFPSPSIKVSDADIRKVSSLKTKEEKVKALTEIVYRDGLFKAIEITRRLNDPYLFDLLHDTLVDELYQKLKGPK